MLRVGFCLCVELQQVGISSFGGVKKIFTFIWFISRELIHECTLKNLQTLKLYTIINTAYNRNYIYIQFQTVAILKNLKNCFKNLSFYV